jgi:hypothetical protein
MTPKHASSSCACHVVLASHIQTSYWVFGPYISPLLKFALNQHISTIMLATLWVKTTYLCVMSDDEVVARVDLYLEIIISSGYLK